MAGTSQLTVVSTVSGNRLKTARQEGQGLLSADIDQPDQRTRS
jgi:hypothetical protein